jgi:hypothetical protein
MNKPSKKPARSRQRAEPAAYFMLVSCLTIRPWRWNRYFPPKRQLTFAWLYGVTSENVWPFRYSEVACTAVCLLKMQLRVTRWRVEQTFAISGNCFCANAEWSRQSLAYIYTGWIHLAWDRPCTFAFVKGQNYWVFGLFPSSGILKRDPTE